MSTIRAPWKCPICKHISSRRWNIKSHIEKKHGGLGVPEQLYGRRDSAFSQNQNTANFQNSIPQNSFYEYIGPPEFHFFNNSIQIDALLEKELEAIIPYFLKLERFLRSRDLPTQNIRETLGHLVLSAIMSHDPVQFMDNALIVYTKKFTTEQMLSDICIAKNINFISIKEYLRRLKWRFLKTGQKV